MARALPPDAEAVDRSADRAVGDVDRVSVRGRLGAFISGGEHAYLYETPGGEVREDHPLLAGPTLVWTGRGHVYRLEAAAPRRKVLQIARSVVP